MSFFSPRLSVGMEDKFLPSVRQPNQGCLRFTAVQSVVLVVLVADNARPMSE